MIRFKIKSSIVHNGLLIYASTGDFSENNSAHCVIPREQVINRLEESMETFLNALVEKLLKQDDKVVVADEEPQADATDLGSESEIKAA